VCVQLVACVCVTACVRLVCESVSVSMCDQFKKDLKQTKKRVCVCGLLCVCVTLYVRHVCVSVCEVRVCLRLVVHVCA